MAGVSQPAPDCALCPRLADFRAKNRVEHPDWHNAPVPGFGSPRPRFLVVGLAPGLRGANCTGRPFTGDAAGDLLYPTLIRFGFARGTYGARPDDGLELVDTAITNAVRCVPPANKPVGAEIRACNSFLFNELNDNPNLKYVLALGRVAHEAILLSHKIKKADYPFKHAAFYELPTGWMLADSYHCSRYNTNTGRLTPAMFEAVFKTIRAGLDAV